MNSHKILAQANFTNDGTEYDFYSVPLQAVNRSDAKVTQTLVTSLIICENSNGIGEFTIWLKPDMSTASGAVEELIFCVSPLTAYQTKIINAGLVLPGDQYGNNKTSGLVVEVTKTGSGTDSTASISMTLMGIEVTR